MSLSIALQMDPLERLNAATDSTLSLAKAALLRGATLFHYEPKNLVQDITPQGVTLTARGRDLTLQEGAWLLGAERTCDLRTCDVLLMRQDPPFDLAYIAATHMLEHLQPHVKIINDPAGVRNAPEKLLVTHFPTLMPPTRITRDRQAIEDFRAQHGAIILKPLFGHAGHGVFHLTPEDSNLPALLETVFALNREPWIVQKYLPIHQHGDKRIVLLNGEPAGSFVRFPATGDSRSNMRVGGRVKAAPLTPRDCVICETLAPVLRAQGLFLTGIDVIGDYLTEINVTSPTGLVTSDQLTGRTGADSLAARFWDLVLRGLP